MGYSTFLLLGIASLIGWNCLLNVFDYFNQVFPDSNSVFLMPIPYYAAVNTIGLLIYSISKFTTMSFRIIIGYLFY